MYQVNSPRIVHETLDGETVIIDTLTGLYYSITGHATVIWLALTRGAEPECVVCAYADAGLFEKDQVECFIRALVEAELITPNIAAHQSLLFSLPEGQGIVPAPLKLERYADLQELIELDPIHEVDVSQGWPIQAKSRN